MRLAIGEFSYCGFFAGGHQLRVLHSVASVQQQQQQPLARYSFINFVSIFSIGELRKAHPSFHHESAAGTA